MIRLKEKLSFNREKCESSNFLSLAVAKRLMIALEKVKLNTLVW